MKRGSSEQETLRLNGWGVGTVLVGDEGYGDTTIEITYLAIDGRRILAKTLNAQIRGEATNNEQFWTLDSREWREVPPVADTISKLRAKAEQRVSGRAEYVRIYGGEPDVPLEIKIDPRDLLQVLDELRDRG